MTLRIELIGGVQVLSCESCNWTGPMTGVKCKGCGKEFTKVRFMTADGSEIYAEKRLTLPES